MVAFADFSVKALEAGLTAKDCGNGHWRLEGGAFQVNWYPGSKKRTAYVNGSNGNSSFFCPNAKRAIEAALTPPPILAKSLKDKRHAGSKRKRIRLLAKNPFCMWCEKPLTLETSTLEHIVPLDCGGADKPFNWGLACEPCNKKRGNLHS